MEFNDVILIFLMQTDVDFLAKKLPLCCLKCCLHIALYFEVEKPLICLRPVFWQTMASLRRYLPLLKDLLIMAAPVCVLVCIQISLGMITLMFAGRWICGSGASKRRGQGWFTGIC